MKDGTALLGRHLTLTGLHHTTPTMPRPLRHVLHATPTTPCPSPSPLSLTRGHLCCKLGPLRGPGAQLRHGVVPVGLSSKATSKSDRWCWRAELCSGSPGPWPSLRRPLERWPVSPGPLTTTHSQDGRGEGGQLHWLQLRGRPALSDLGMVTSPPVSQSHSRPRGPR